MVKGMGRKTAAALLGVCGFGMVPQEGPLTITNASRKPWLLYAPKAESTLLGNTFQAHPDGKWEAVQTKIVDRGYPVRFLLEPGQQVTLFFAATSKELLVQTFQLTDAKNSRLCPPAVGSGGYDFMYAQFPKDAKDQAGEVPPYLDFQTPGAEGRCGRLVSGTHLVLDQDLVRAAPTPSAQPAQVLAPKPVLKPEDKPGCCSCF